MRMVSDHRAVTVTSGTCAACAAVTRKPPATLIAASRTATPPERPARRRAAAVQRQHAADDDDAADRVGDAHQRRVQRRRHVPDDVPADDTRQQEHGEVLRGTRAAPKIAAAPSRIAASAAHDVGPLLLLVRRLRARRGALRVAAGRRRLGRRRGGGRRGCGGGHSSSPSLRTSAPRWISSFEVDAPAPSRPCTSP